MNLTNLTAISPLDGRYLSKVSELQPIFSEFALIKYRVTVEIKWLKYLLENKIIDTKLSNSASLDDVLQNFSEQDATEIKTIEQATNHDVKAIEYFIRKKLNENTELKSLSNFIHFACTSEDINNLGYGLMLRSAIDSVLLPNFTNLIVRLRGIAHGYAATPMLARTHGQAATPTTFGKEIANFVARLKSQQDKLANVIIRGKLNGATGNYNAHVLAYPDLDWGLLAKKFVEGLGLVFNSHTTQIEPHDDLADLFQTISRANTILLDFCRDIWGYISIGYLTQKVVASEIGSSTMPHKVNPIDFENAEGNLGLANAVFTHLAEKLPISRWQRDLSDSTVMRNIGVAFAYTLLAYKMLLNGLSKIEVNEKKMNTDLEDNWEVLAEGIQTVMRRYGVGDAYEQLKELTHGRKVNKQILHHFIEKLDLPLAVKRELKSLTPQAYLGSAKQLALMV